MTSFSLDYSAHQSASAYANIEKAAALLDGTVIAPEKELSLNEILGPRTESNGWKTAPSITGGSFVSQLGSGISAISSALYNAAIRAELKIVNCAHHTIVSDYVPGGLDATISTGGPDLKVFNPYGSDVTLQCQFENGAVTG